MRGLLGGRSLAGGKEARAIPPLHPSPCAGVISPHSIFFLFCAPPFVPPSGGDFPLFSACPLDRLRRLIAVNTGT